MQKRPKNQFAIFRGLRSYLSVKSNHNSERGRPRYIFKVPKTTFDFRCPPAKISCIPPASAYHGREATRGGGFVHEKGRIFFLCVEKRVREILGMSRCGAIFRINIVGYFLVLLVEYWKDVKQMHIYQAGWS